MNKPTVTALMPVYNGESFIEEAVQSVINQDFADWELIVVDDGSTDRTPEILKSLRDPRIQIISLERNHWAGYARNIALQDARGEYIAICDSDDISCPNRFSTQVTFLDRNPGIGVVASQLQYIDTTGQLIEGQRFPTSSSAIARRFARGRMGLPNASAMIRASLFVTFGGYASESRYAQDLELFLRFHPSVRFRNLDGPLVQYRTKPRKLTLEKWVLYESYRRYAVYRSLSTNAGETPVSYSTYLENEPLRRLFERCLDSANYGAHKLIQLI